METNIKKWGNSLAIRLPKEILSQNDLREGSRIAILEKEGEIVLKKKESLALSELISGISKENTHQSYWEDIPVVGKEIW
jgi:antitoxin MazE